VRKTFILLIAAHLSLSHFPLFTSPAPQLPPSQWRHQKLFTRETGSVKLLINQNPGLRFPGRKSLHLKKWRRGRKKKQKNCLCPGHPTKKKRGKGGTKKNSGQQCHPGSLRPSRRGGGTGDQLRVNFFCIIPRGKKNRKLIGRPKNTSHRASGTKKTSMGVWRSSRLMLHGEGGGKTGTQRDKITPPCPRGGGG